MYRYYITYTITTDQGTGTSWSAVTLPHKLREAIEVAALAEQIRLDRGAQLVVITDWRRFED